MSIYRRVLGYYRPFWRPTLGATAAHPRLHRLQSPEGLALRLPGRSCAEPGAAPAAPRGARARFFVLAGRRADSRPLRADRPLPLPRRAAESRHHAHLCARGPAGAAAAPHAALRLPALAAAEVSRRAPHGRFLLPRRVRLAIDPIVLREGHLHLPVAARASSAPSSSCGGSIGSSRSSRSRWCP